MAFARWSATSHVYVFSTLDRGVECCGCALDTSALFVFSDFESLAAHLREHLAAGHLVPEDLFDPQIYEPDYFAPGRPS
jgi:hypothetical protein